MNKELRTVVVKGEIVVPAGAYMFTELKHITLSKISRVRLRSISLGSFVYDANDKLLPDSTVIVELQAFKLNQFVPDETDMMYTRNIILMPNKIELLDVIISANKLIEFNCNARLSAIDAVNDSFGDYSLTIQFEELDLI